MTAVPLASAPLPEHIGRFEVVLLLGTGGMANVYLARATALGGFERLVAVKLMHPFLAATTHAAQSFLDEGKLSARIRHPHVVPVTDVGQDEHGVFLVMDYIDGDSLWALINESMKREIPIPIPIALRLMNDALSGLHAAHELRGENGEALSLVHRDFSPHNILVGLDGVARLTDFGIAKCADRERFTETGMVKGKISYMSPEQARGLPLDCRSDVWSAGVIAWELLANRRFLEGTSETAKLLHIISGDFTSPRSVRPDLPAALGEVVMQALTRHVDRRVPTAALFRDRLVAAWGDSLADDTEVAAYVTHVLGATLAERQDRIASERTRLDSVTMATVRMHGSEASDVAVPRENPTRPLERPNDAATGSVSPRASRAGVWLLGAASLATLFSVGAWVRSGRGRHSEAPLGGHRAALEPPTTTMEDSPVPSSELSPLASTLAPSASENRPPTLRPMGKASSAATPRAPRPWPKPKAAKTSSSAPLLLKDPLDNRP